MRRVCLILTYLFYLTCISLAIPNNLKCRSAIDHENYNLKNCILSKSKIYCQTFISIPPNDVLALNSTYYLKDESPNGEYQYCIGVEDVKITKTHALPPGVTNVHRFSKINPIAQGARSLKDMYVHMTFNNTASIGLLQLQQQCVGKNIMELDESCIKELLVSTIMLAPTDADITFLDLFESKVQEFYFQTLHSKIENLKLEFYTELNLNNLLDYIKDAVILDVDLSNSKLKDDFVLHNLEHLSKLNLKNCSVKHMDSISFDYGAPNIEVLDMSDNKMTTPPVNTKMLSHLHTLNLSGQKVNKFELGEELKSLRNVKNLDLSHMPLSGLTRSSLPNTTTLEVLNLTNCHLNEIYEQTFHNSPGLKEINLSNNKLTYIHPKTFAKMSPGSKINLENNNIKSVQKLYLQDNVEITGITFERFSAYNNGIRNIGFIRNIIIIPILFIVLFN